MRYVKDSPLELGHRVWQLRPPTPSLTVVVKGTFDPAAGSPAPFAAEQIPPTGEVYVDDDVEGPLRLPSDFPLLKPWGECFVVGAAHAPRGRPMPAVVCRFKIGRVEKRIVVYGDRRWSQGVIQSLSEPEPFRSMGLSMDRAYGGPGHAPNPWGRGREPVDGVLFAPNLERPGDPIDAPGRVLDPVVVGPVPMTWPDRMKHAGTYDAEYMRTRWPWLPADFDWRFFLASPRDQQLGEGFWRGDERVELEALHPEHVRIDSRLPGIVPRVFLDLTEPRPRFDEVPLNLDTVTYDAELGKLLLTWRGLVEVPSESLAELAHVFVAHDVLGTRPRTREELEARCRELLREEEEEEEEAEGEVPAVTTTASDLDAVADAEPASDDEVDEEEAEPEPGSVEADLLEKLAAADARLAALGADAAPPEHPEYDPDAFFAKMEAAGAPIPADLKAEMEALRAEDETEDEPEDETEEPLPASPATPEGRALVEARLAAGEPLAELDLSGADLSGMDLSGQDLTRAILRGANLEEAGLERAVLAEANLSKANLFRARLAGADLTFADLFEANLRWVDLLGATLDDATLDGATMVQARLAEAKMRAASAIGVDLTEAVMTKGDFTDTDFERSTLVRVDATQATFRAVILEEANAEGANFDHALMTQVRAEGLRAKNARFGTIDAEDSFWEGAELSGADFSFARLTRADFTGAVLIGTELDGCLLRGARFERANAHSLKARKADLMEASFESSDLSFADLRGANLFGAQLWRAKLTEVQLALADVRRTTLEEKA
ncbi:MAG: DUF2169 domain-containing protein [Myxococcales bacterium]|nr:DUF2169 domain-containing protein [Myxococcales bacterium]